MQIKEIEQKLFQYFSTRPEIKLGYVFGSLSKGGEHRLSDIDIAILVEEEKVPRGEPYGYKAMIISDIMALLKTDKVDLVVLNEAPLILCFRVVYEGIVVYSIDEKMRVEFETKVMSLYFDRQYYYRRHDELAINRIAKEGIL